jgi:hypothetical protein
MERDREGDREEIVITKGRRERRKGKKGSDTPVGVSVGVSV